MGAGGASYLNVLVGGQQVQIDLQVRDAARFVPKPLKELHHQLQRLPCSEPKSVSSGANQETAACRCSLTQHALLRTASLPQPLDQLQASQIRPSEGTRLLALLALNPLLHKPHHVSHRVMDRALRAAADENNEPEPEQSKPTKSWELDSLLALLWRTPRPIQQLEKRVEVGGVELPIIRAANKHDITSAQNPKQRPTPVLVVLEDLTTDPELFHRNTKRYQKFSRFCSFCLNNTDKHQRRKHFYISKIIRREIQHRNCQSQTQQVQIPLPSHNNSGVWVRRIHASDCLPIEGEDRLLTD